MVTLRHFSFFLALPAFLTPTSASIFTNPNSQNSASSLNTFHRRAVTLNTCQTINITVPLSVTPPPICVPAIPPLTGQICTPQTGLVRVELHLADAVCLCISGGVLTSDSVAKIGNISAGTGGSNPTIFNQLINSGVYTVNSLKTYITSIVPSILGSYSNTCPYGNDPNVVPNVCGGCGFTCSNGYAQCGGTCIAPTRACVSGVPSRRRRDFSQHPNTLCTRGLTPCLIPDGNRIPIFNGENYECIDTSQDLESCGGCTYPLPSQPAGQDCTTLPQTSGVICKNSKCLIESCQKGFLSNGTACLPSGTLLSQSRTITFELSPLDSLESVDLSAEALSNIVRSQKGRDGRRGKNWKRDREVYKRLQVSAGDLRVGRKKLVKGKAEGKGKRKGKGKIHKSGRRS